MKNHIHILLAVIILGFGVLPSHADTDLDKVDKDLTKKLSDVLTQWEKITPGMTRAQLTNDFTLDIGPAISVYPPAFQQHERFLYRGCFLIKVDVDFAPSDSKEARPTDIIAKMSKPYLERSLAD
jgi:hypothetical protein